MGMTGYEQRREFFIEHTLKPFAKKHGISLKSAVSLVVRDFSLVDGVETPTYRDLFSYRETHQFCFDLWNSGLYADKV